MPKKLKKVVGWAIVIPHLNEICTTFVGEFMVYRSRNEAKHHKFCNDHIIQKVSIQAEGQMIYIISGFILMLLWTVADLSVRVEKLEKKGLLDEKE